MLRNLLLCALALTGIAACEGETSNTEAVGDLTVRISTTGDNLDPDGYTLQLVGVGSTPVNLADTVQYTALPIGDYQVNLSDRSVNCAVAGGASKLKYISVGSNTLQFDVTCS